MRLAMPRASRPPPTSCRPEAGAAKSNTRTPLNNNVLLAALRWKGGDGGMATAVTATFSRDPGCIFLCVWEEVVVRGLTTTC